MSICQNQKSFDKAMRKAIKYDQNKEKISRVSLIISLGISLLLIVWALSLVYNLNNNNNSKIIHYILAIVFSPFYLISYYVRKNN